MVCSLLNGVSCSSGLNYQRLSYCRGSVVFGDQGGRLSAAKGSWTSGGVEWVLSATISASSFASRLNPKTAKTTESRPAAAMAPAPTLTVVAEAVTRPITAMPAPKRAIPRTNKRYTLNFSSFCDEAACVGDMEGALTIDVLAAPRPSRQSYLILNAKDK